MSGACAGRVALVTGASRGGTGTAIAATSFAVALLSLAVLSNVVAILMGDDGFEWSWLWVSLPAILWIAWGVVFYLYRERMFASLTRTVGWLLNGSVLQLLVAVPAHIVGAWLLAWPLTQWGLLVRPELTHYGGLSGVLHAGVAAVALHLLVVGPRRRRIVGLALLVGLTIKVFGEVPWGPAVTHPPGWDIAIAPIAHASGTLAGLLCALGAVLIHARRHSAEDPNEGAPG